jgi:hypothetical protein
LASRFPRRVTLFLELAQFRGEAVGHRDEFIGRQVLELITHLGTGRTRSDNLRHRAFEVACEVAVGISPNGIGAARLTRLAQRATRFEHPPVGEVANLGGARERDGGNLESEGRCSQRWVAGIACKLVGHRVNLGLVLAAEVRAMFTGDGGGSIAAK